MISTRGRLETNRSGLPGNENESKGLQTYSFTIYTDTDNDDLIKNCDGRMLRETCIGTALLLALGAGLSTMIGSLIGFVMKNPGPKFISFTVGFSAGIMIFISCGELLPGAITTEGIGFLKAHAAFFSGMAGYFLIDLFVPHDYLGQHDHARVQECSLGLSVHHTMERTGVLVALGLSIHNIPKGMAIFVAGVKDIHLGLRLPRQSPSTISLWA